MPFVDVTFDPARVPAEVLAQLGRALPDLVAQAVACEEAPRAGQPGPGDIEVRFRERHRFDVGELALAIEVRTVRFDSRVANAQRRADLIRDGVREVVGRLPFGAWLILHEGAWSQSP